MTVTVTIHLADLRGLAVYALNAAALDRSVIFRGVHFHPTATGFNAVASNRHALALLSLPADAIEGRFPDYGLTLPVAALYHLDTEYRGPVKIALGPGHECGIHYPRGRTYTILEPPMSDYPDYLERMPDTANPVSLSSFAFSAGEMRLAATALELFATNSVRPHDTAQFLFHRPNGPHEMRLYDRDDIRLLFMPCRNAETEPSAPETPQ